MSRLLSTLSLAGALLLAATVWAQSPLPAGRPPAAPKAVAKPTWKELTPAQREALAPLAAEWDTYDRDRKLKWLEVAKKFPQLTPEGRQRVHERMVQFAKLSPEEKRTARLNFQRAYELPLEQRQSLIQQYQELPPEKKQALAEKARKKPEPPRATKSPAKKQDSGTTDKPIN
jgi:hypothetical protein